METLLQTLRNLGPMRLSIMGGVVFGLIAFFIFLSTRLSSPQLSLLYGDLDTNDATRIAAQLDAQSIPYELKKNGTELYVPADQVSRMRLAMAQQGLPSGGTVGYELFDSADSLGSTDFVQNINLVRALEGELSRTIGAIESVRSARVHLVMPRRELFSREKQEPSASIVLKMKGIARLDRGQVTAIQHLVAAAVPKLTPNRISIIDDKGSLLAGGFEDLNDPATAAVKTEERKRTFENRMARTVEELLERAVGYGRVRAEVRADMDFDRISTSEEQYNPDGQVVRSTQTVEENASSREADPQAVTVANNLPDPNQNAGGASATSAESRTEETVNYEISKKVINHVKEVGTVNRLSVAVLVDGVYAPDGQGQRAYTPRPEQEMTQLANLVRSAIGFNAGRGDTLEVINMQFAEPDTPAEAPLVLFLGLNKQDMLRMAEILVLSIVAILVILLVVRPLLTRAFEALPVASAAPAEGRLLADESMPTPALAGPSEAPGQDEFEELIDIDRVEGRVKASSVKKVGEIVDKHPTEALAIVRAWMYQEA